MHKSARNLLFLLFFLVPLLAASDEQQKAHKIVNKVTAMAIDPAGKRAVSLSMSQYLSAGRAEVAFDLNRVLRIAAVAHQLLDNLDALVGRNEVQRFLAHRAPQNRPCLFHPAEGVERAVLGLLPSLIVSESYHDLAVGPILSSETSDMIRSSTERAKG